MKKAKETEYIGLWQNSNNCYSSGYIRKKVFDEIGGMAMIKLFKNKFKEKGDNKPYFILKLLNREAVRKNNKAIALDIALKEHEIDLIDTEKVISLSDAISVARNLLYDMQYGYSIDDLIVEVERFMNDKSFQAVRFED